MASRDLQDLHPDTRLMAESALESCATDAWMIENNVQVLVTCTYRSNEEQAADYAQGRTKAQLDAVGLLREQPRPGPIITKALPGKSKHNAVNEKGEPAARAIDIVPKRDGKLVWGQRGEGINDDPTDDKVNDLEAWQRIARHFKAAGFRWYGDQDAPFHELPHFQDPNA